jgi:hypothetical protein
MAPRLGYLSPPNQSSTDIEGSNKQKPSDFTNVGESTDLNTYL